MGIQNKDMVIGSMRIANVVTSSRNSEEKQPTTDLVTVHDEINRPSYYDALVCYADCDVKQALDLAQHLERDYDIRLCLSDRDILPATSFYTTLSYLITHRCRKVIVLLTSATNVCPTCDFVLKFATYEQAAIIPLVLSPCTVPLLLQTKVICDVAHIKHKPNFWNNFVFTILSDDKSSLRSHKQLNTYVAQSLVSCTSDTTQTYDTNSADSLIGDEFHDDFDIEEYFKCLESSRCFIVRKFITNMCDKVRRLKNSIRDD